jgi:hypothetical protein
MLWHLSDDMFVILCVAAVAVMSSGVFAAVFPFSMFVRSVGVSVAIL